MGDKTMKVGCRVPQGLRLSVSDWFDNPSTGAKSLREIGVVDLAGTGEHRATAGVTERAGITEVDAGLFETWFAANESSDLVTSGAVFKPTAEEVADYEKVEPVSADETPATDDAPAGVDGKGARAAKTPKASPIPGPVPGENAA